MSHSTAAREPKNVAPRGSLPVFAIPILGRGRACRRSEDGAGQPAVGGGNITKQPAAGTRKDGGGSAVEMQHGGGGGSAVRCSMAGEQQAAANPIPARGLKWSSGGGRHERVVCRPGWHAACPPHLSCWRSRNK
uniref:Uncharacterized protein n=1 Tax=Setaria viridis TaxID=4556 RepID=A0A4U6WN54_SETVI|nr:hypothetical protein SEVIR_1G219150v2 [Setaria viridis]